MLFQVKLALNHPSVLKISFSRRFYRDSHVYTDQREGKLDSGFSSLSASIEFALQIHLNATITGTQAYSKVIETPISLFFSHAHFCTTEFVCCVERIASLILSSSASLLTAQTGDVPILIYSLLVFRMKVNPFQIQMCLVFRLINDDDRPAWSLRNYMQVLRERAERTCREQNRSDFEKARKFFQNFFVRMISKIWILA